MRYLLLILFLMSSCTTHHKIKIKTQPCLYPQKGYNFTLCRKFIYYINGHKLIIPSGFSTDLASIPKILWSIYSPNKANTIAPAVIHDYLYFCPEQMSRTEADSIFYDALIYNKVKTRAAFQYWIAVRIFGHSHFNEGAYCSINLSSIRNNFGLSRNMDTV